MELKQRTTWGDDGIHNGWLYVNDPTGDERWSLRVSAITGWHFDVGGARLTIETDARTYVVSGDIDAEFDAINNLDAWLYQATHS